MAQNPVLLPQKMTYSLKLMILNNRLALVQENFIIWRRGWIKSPVIIRPTDENPYTLIVQGQSFIWMVVSVDSR